MKNDTRDRELDGTDEDILAFEVSDDALEAAAALTATAPTASIAIVPPNCC
jgi:hypothetical protein